DCRSALRRGNRPLLLEHAGEKSSTPSAARAASDVPVRRASALACRVVAAATPLLGILDLVPVARMRCRVYPLRRRGRRLPWREVANAASFESNLSTYYLTLGAESRVVTEGAAHLCLSPGRLCYANIRSRDRRCDCVLVMQSAQHR